MSPKSQFKVEKILLSDRPADSAHGQPSENSQRPGQVIPLRGHPLKDTEESGISPFASLFAKRASDVMRPGDVFRPEASLANLQMMRKVKGN